MRGLRILHVTPYSAEAWAYGGIPRVVAALISGLANRGHDVTICATDAGGPNARLGAEPLALEAWPPSTRNGVTLRVFPNVSNRAAYHAQLFLPIGLGGFLRRHAREYDVAHLHACRNLPGVIAARHLRAAGVPYVLAPNGTAINIERRRLAKQVFDLMFGNSVMRGASRLIAVSEAERAQLHQLDVPDAAVRVVPNPIDLSEFSPPPVRGRFLATHLPHGARAVLFLGRLSPRKRVDDLIAAFARLRAAGRFSNVWLIVAGNDMGSGGRIRALLAAAGVEDRARMIGLLEGRQRLEALADADVVVYPSEHEIFGLVPLEALLAGTPVVVAGDSGCGEVISSIGGGQVVPAADVDALTSAIAAVLDHPDRYRAAAVDAAARVRQRFARDPVCRAIEEIYLELCPSQATARSSPEHTRSPRPAIGAGVAS
ncbi:MAG TPA: glycosyltransferase [Vicinamibacterales bacterium]|nr:glycosyltransferase [Vicinamibacterales bacterium]